jgi:hypothetical protein
MSRVFTSISFEEEDSHLYHNLCEESVNYIVIIY